MSGEDGTVPPTDAPGDEVLEMNSDDSALWFALGVLAVTLMLFVYLVTAFAQSKVRFQVFNKEFMAQFDEEHEKAFGVKAPLGGHPD